MVGLSSGLGVNFKGTASSSEKPDRSPLSVPSVCGTGTLAARAIFAMVVAFNDP